MEYAEKKGRKHFVVSAKTGEGIGEMMQIISKLCLKKAGVFWVEKPWSATVESDKEWGSRLRSIVLTLLLIRKRKENLISKLPKPLIFLIVTIISESVIESQDFDWFEEKKEKFRITKKFSSALGAYS